jgi:hypothetical protein
MCKASIASVLPCPWMRPAIKGTLRELAILGGGLLFGLGVAYGVWVMLGSGAG